MLGLTNIAPKFVKKYINIEEIIKKAANQYSSEEKSMKIAIEEGSITAIHPERMEALGAMLVEQLKKDGFWIVAMENSLDAKDWHKIDYKDKIVIVAGSEGHGIKKIILDNCDFQTLWLFSNTI